jgi:hypothetical protein
VSRERVRDYVAMYSFFTNNRPAYQRLPQWVQRHSVLPIIEDGFLMDRDAWRSGIAAAVHEYGDLHPLAFMVYLRNISLLTSKSGEGGIPLILAPIYGLAGERDEGVDFRVHSDPDYLWGVYSRWAPLRL